MKRLIVTGLLGVMALGCGKTTPATLNVVSSFLSVGSAGGEEQISFLSSQDWSVVSDQPWVSVEPASGAGSESYQHVTVTVAANDSEADREAGLTFRAGELTRPVRIGQAGEPRCTISDFRAAKADGSTWYKLTGEIATLPEERYGNFYLVDETGYVFVYGLCASPVAKNDESFASLGLKAGDTVTLMTLRTEYNGTIEAGGTTPAYFVSRQEGEYKLGRKAASARAGWMELPATSDADGQDLLMHSFPDGTRSYAAYWDYEHLVASWVAYPLHAGNIGSGGRTVESQFPMDPLLTRAQQPYLSRSFQTASGSYDRGHQIPSADRLDWRVNLETFFSTNMTPQASELNSGAWETLESKVRSWARHADTDTLYVVTGCSVAGSVMYATDSDDKKITVPTGYYKALLRLDKAGNYSALGIWFDNKSDRSGSIRKEMTMSIAALEEKTGVDFFVNLPADVRRDVQAQDPAGTAWWWNN